MSFDAWIDFQRGERVTESRLVCCECGKKAEGNVEIVGEGQICDACHAGLIEEENKQRK